MDARCCGYGTLDEIKKKKKEKNNAQRVEDKQTAKNVNDSMAIDFWSGRREKVGRLDKAQILNRVLNSFYWRAECGRKLKQYVVRAGTCVVARSQLRPHDSTLPFPTFSHRTIDVDRFRLFFVLVLLSLKIEKSTNVIVQILACLKSNGQFFLVPQ